MGLSDCCCFIRIERKVRSIYSIHSSKSVTFFSLLPSSSHHFLSRQFPSILQSSFIVILVQSKTFSSKVILSQNNKCHKEKRKQKRKISLPFPSQELFMTIFLRLHQFSSDKKMKWIHPHISCSWSSFF